jgi:hypothetical protein
MGLLARSASQQNEGNDVSHPPYDCGLKAGVPLEFFMADEVEERVLREIETRTCEMRQLRPHVRRKIGQYCLPRPAPTPANV